MLETTIETRVESLLCGVSPREETIDLVITTCVRIICKLGILDVEVEPARRAMHRLPNNVALWASVRWLDDAKPFALVLSADDHAHMVVVR